MARRLSIGGAALLVWLGWAWIGSGWMAGAGGGIVLGWGLGAAERWRWAVAVWLAGGIGLTAGSAMQGSAWWLALAAAGLLVVGWDLLRLKHRLAATGWAENETRLVANHLRYLAPVSTLGLAAGLATVTVRLGLRLEGAIVLGLIFALSLSAALHGIRQREAGSD